MCTLHEKFLTEKKALFSSYILKITYTFFVKVRSALNECKDTRFKYKSPTWLSLKRRFFLYWLFARPL